MNFIDGALHIEIRETNDRSLPIKAGISPSLYIYVLKWGKNHDQGVWGEISKSASLTEHCKLLMELLSMARAKIEKI